MNTPTKRIQLYYKEGTSRTRHRAKQRQKNNERTNRMLI